MESRTDMLARHARELAELDSRWWEEWFTEDPVHVFRSRGTDQEFWFKNVIPTIIRKREKIGVTITFEPNRWNYCKFTFRGGLACTLPMDFAEALAGRTLAPGEKVEI